MTMNTLPDARPDEYAIALIVSAVDELIERFSGRGLLAAGEVVDALLDLRTTATSTLVGFNGH